MSRHMVTAFLGALLIVQLVANGLVESLALRAVVANQTLALLLHKT